MSPLFTDIFRDSGLLGLLLAQLRKHAKILRKSGASLERQEGKGDGPGSVFAGPGLCSSPTSINVTERSEVQVSLLP